MSFVRIAIFAIAGCTICGASYHAIQTQKQEDQLALEQQVLSHMQEKDDDLEKALVYYARHPIPKGTLVNISFLSTQRVAIRKIPTDVITDYRQVENRVTKFDIPTGQLLSRRDLVPINPPMEPASNESRGCEIPTTEIK
jgi:flagella basal body P-ring formation protein FlgA